MSNHRVDCPYCKQDVLSRDIGKHIVKKHEENLFTETTKEGLYNRRMLWRDEYLTQPMPLDLGLEYCFYACFDDLSLIKTYKTAELHFKKEKIKNHREKIESLRERYPRPTGEEIKEIKSTGFNADYLKILQEAFCDMLDVIRDYEKKLPDEKPFDYKNKFKKLKRLTPANLDEDYLKKNFGTEYEVEEPKPKEEKKQTKVKEEQKVQEESQVFTKEQLASKLVEDSGLDEFSKQMLQQQLAKTKRGIVQPLQNPSMNQTYTSPQPSYPAIITNSKTRK